MKSLFYLAAVNKCIPILILGLYFSDHGTAWPGSDLGKLIGIGRLHAVLGQYAVEALGVVSRRPDARYVRHRSRFLAGFLLGQRLAERPGAGATLKVR